MCVIDIILELSRGDVFWQFNQDHMRTIEKLTNYHCGEREREREILRFRNTKSRGFKKLAIGLVGIETDH